MKKNKGLKYVFIITTIVLLGLSLWGFNYYKDFKISLEKLKLSTEKKLKDKEYIEKLKSHYSKYVVVSEETNLYSLNEKDYVENGKIGKDIELELNDIKLDVTTKYFSFNFGNEEYFIEYDKVTKIDALSKNQKRYEHYVPFDENVVTNEKYSLYDGDNLAFTFIGQKDFPIYIKEDNSYGIVFNEKIYYIKKEDVSSTKLNGNATKAKATRIATIVYHFIYDQEKETCNEIICHTTKQVKSHLDFLKSNDYFTLTMDEFELFVDKKLNVQKNSILITLDDGGYAYNAKALFTEYEMNLSMFIVSSWFDPKSFETEFVEVHSHSDNLHNTGACPTGQGGGIQCLDKAVLLADLKKSREKTNMTTAFCYPFYEYNDYSISVLKEAGFTLGFGGTYSGGSYKAYPGYKKFEIPRITFLNTTTVNDLKEVLEG